MTAAAIALLGLGVMFSVAFGLAAKWASWVSQTLVAILKASQRTDGRVDAVVDDIVDLRRSSDDHEGRLRGLETR